MLFGLAVMKVVVFVIDFVTVVAVDIVRGISGGGGTVVLLH